MIAFVFPGQGTVRVGMGGWLRRDTVASPVLARAEEVLGIPLAELCTRGPLDRLVSTEVAQLAVTSCNLAALAVLRERGVSPDLVAGHSVGELSALCAAGVLDVDATLELVAVRSRLMAGVPDHGGMTAVLGPRPDVVATWAAKVSTPDEPLVVGLANAPDHTVVSGSFRAIERLSDVAGADPATRKVVPLSVGNAFHSPLMEPAAAAWAEAVAAVPMAAPRVPVVPNTTAEPTTDAGVLRTALIEQLTAPVRWTETMGHLTGADRCVEVGDSKVLSGLLRGVGVRCASLADPAALRQVVRAG
ncbi:ACP S-malonyltransferase [Pseudonocardia nematodicida]|uniref:Malonyl CoA-acyl carrier protein transacylase n=1 Tax=Pseudonocardia nematodicida TaxID=1206997 RepID=A0ABV1K9Y5_9PSEU